MADGNRDEARQAGELPEELADKARAAEATFWGYLGCELAEAADGRAVVRLNIRPQHLNMLQIVHGGVIASLLDNAMGVAAMAALPGLDTVTAGLHVHFVAPARSGRLTASAEIVHRSRRTVTLTGTVTDAAGAVCAIGTASFRVVGGSAG